MKRRFFNKSKVFTAALTAIVCAAVLGIPGCSSADSSSEKSSVTTTVAQAQETSPASEAGSSQDTVTVTARGNTRAVPDRAELRFGVRTQADTAEEAQQANSKNVDAVVKVLKKNGIKEENIQTSMYDVSPQYDWNTGDGSKVIGYSAFSNLSVKDVPIDDAGKLITACTNAGANEWTNYAFTTGEAGAMNATGTAPYYPAGAQNIDIVAFYPASAGTSSTNASVSEI